MALYHFSAKVLSHSSRNTVGAVAYRAGCQLEDLKTGQTFDYQDKPVQHVELVIPKNAPQWIQDIQKVMKEDRQKGVQALSEVVEAAEYRINSQVWREIEVALHRELTDEQNIALAREFVEDQLCGRGMVAQLNFHFDVDEKTGDAKPHCHILVTMRQLDEQGFDSKKERSWNAKSLMCELREQWAHYSNFHLKLHGHDVKIDHRSYHEQGIEIEPQPKRGKNVLEQEDRLGKQVGPVTDKGKAFREVQLRNLYRILSRPELVLEMVTKHHTTFMWVDVQKKLHQYIDEIPLFQKMEARLRNSNELVKLHSGGDQKTKEDSLRENPLRGDVSDKAIYTTRAMLKAETSLVEIAEQLGNSQTHGVEKNQVERAMMQAYQGLGIVGGLSLEQEKAIQHLVGEGQLNCVVGIAGSGKTTILGVCHEVWKSDGYAVYGLAPTGKAAQNLEQSGIQSTTVHKFLKEFKAGRCQYTSKSVLVLDEAGMVDVERFSSLLSVVKQLGVKLIVVGDGAQLQPVEAGPAFRLITERVGKVELMTVVRQKEDWQKEATVLFGKQRTQEALQRYVDKGHLHIVEEKLPSLREVIANKDYEGLVKLYEVSNRVTSLIYREMAREGERAETPSLIRDHQDFGRYLTWKELEKDAAKHILEESKACRPILESRFLDPTKMALLFVDKNQEASFQQEEVINILKSCGLDHLVGLEKSKGQGVELRQTAKEALLTAWHSSCKDLIEKNAHLSGSIMLSFSNRDVKDLNSRARFLLKTSGQLDSREFTYTTKKEIDDDFGKKHAIAEDKGFSKGDRIVFTRNNYGLGVKNGSMGIITDLTPQKIHVKLDEGALLEGALSKETNVSFAPKLNPFFDHGWAITIHKSQGTTVDKAYVLASAEMNQNLAYVSMTRHREDVQMFGSSLDFWREEKLPEMLSKSGEKLSAADYLDANSLEELMRKEDHFITKIFERVSDELEAMGAVSKRAFWQVADHFLGINRGPEISVNPETFSRDSIREEARADSLLQEKRDSAIFQDISIPQSTSPVSNPKTYLPQSRGTSSQLPDTQVVEDALKQNMASFADDTFSSLGEPLHKASSSATQRRYGKNGHISVNLRTGAWINFKDSDLSGGPLHMLTKLKGLSFKEAVEYGASWAGLTNGSNLSSQSSIHTTGKTKKEDLEKSLSAIKSEHAKTRITKAQTLWEKSVPIKDTLAERYLREHRKIEGELPKDLRYIPDFKVYPRPHDPNYAGDLIKARGVQHGKSEDGSRDSYPCLIAASRSPEGEVAAVQITFLDPQTAAKATIATPKKSFGILKGSALTIQEDKESNVLFVAEGVETALSLKAAEFRGNIKVSLGLSNVSHLIPEHLLDETSSTHVIICADHDLPDSSASKSLKKSVLTLQEKLFQKEGSVTVIKPDKLNEDFNDLLKMKGPQGVREIIERNLSKTLIKATQSPTSVPSQSDSFQSLSTSEKAFHLSLRAKYEARRIPEIWKELIEDWQSKDSFKHNEGILAHMIAERLSSIEGRLYLEAKKKELPPPSNIAELAHKELKEHRAETKALIQELVKTYALSENAATHCAKDILRFKETYGEKPSDGQIFKMAQISHELEKKDYNHVSKNLDQHEIDFLRRREGDLMFKQTSSPDFSHTSSNDSDELHHIQTQVKASFKKITPHIAEEIERTNQKEISL